MSRRKTGRDAGRPRTHARLVYEDWPCGVWVRGWQVDYREWSSIVYVKVRTGSVLCTRTLLREWWESLMGEKKGPVHATYVQKALQQTAASGLGAACHDADLAAACPALHEFLTLSRLPDGKTRQTATLSVFVEGSLWKCVLNERESNLTLWATAETLQGLWMELEQRLTADQVDWRPGRRLETPTQQKPVDRRQRGR